MSKKEETVVMYDVKSFMDNTNGRLGYGEKWTLRYISTVPFDRRPHAPTEAMFDDPDDAYAHLDKQPNDLDLEVVKR